MARRAKPRYGPRPTRTEPDETMPTEGNPAASTPADAGSDTHFGYTTVPLGQKQHLVDDVFHKVARRYDLMNDLMSAGLHRVWKDATISTLRPSRDRPWNHLDVAGGTGDVAFRVLDAAGPAARVTVLDINADMLAVGRERTPARFAGQIEFVEGNAESLPYPDKTFDAYTIAFGIRNVPRIERALSEAFRVLKRGGRFLCLEFSHVDVPGLDAIYDAYSFTAVPALGKVVTGDGAPYRYLVESIRQFPRPAAFSQMIRDAGFRVSERAMSGGIVRLHSGWKL
jgi:demethylmenaquinone methyltransferase / 2-methoxy-6-polyprenyl-1,4-benzoquinol methylase